MRLNEQLMKLSALVLLDVVDSAEDGIFFASRLRKAGTGPYHHDEVISHGREIRIVALGFHKEMLVIKKCDVERRVERLGETMRWRGNLKRGETS